MCLALILTAAATLMCLSSCDREQKFKIGVSLFHKYSWREKLCDEMRYTSFKYSNVVLDIASAENDGARQARQIKKMIDNGINLINLIYNYLTICKWVVYEFCFWNKKQIRNKNGFLGKSSFFCLHYFSFLSLACNQSTNPSYYNAFSSWFNICFFIYPGIRSEKRKVLFSMIDINMCKVKNNHPSNQIFVYF